MALKEAYKISLIFFQCALTPSTFAANSPFEATPLGEDLLLVSGPAGNTLVARDDAGLVLVDGVPGELAEDYLAFVERMTGTREVRTLINTHWHPEVTGLNERLGGEGVEIVAHTYTRQWLASTIRERGDVVLHRPLSAEALPDTTFEHTFTQSFGDGGIEYGYLPLAHTDGDIYVYFPEQNVLFTGGALRADAWTTVDAATNGFLGGLLDAWSHLLEEVVDDETVIVPASGAVLDKTALAAMHEDYAALMTTLVGQLRKSMSVQEVIAAQPAQGLRPEWGDPARFLDASYRSFYGHLRESEYVGAMP